MIFIWLICRFQTDQFWLQLSKVIKSSGIFFICLRDDLVYYDEETSYKEMKEKVDDSDAIDDEITKLHDKLKQQENDSQSEY